MKKRFWRRRKAHKGQPTMVGDILGTWLQNKARNPIVLHGNKLFENWAMILGSDLAEDMYPIGIHNKTLQVAAEDSMILQDIRMNSAEILRRVNAFMMECGDDLCFEKIEFSLIQGRTILTQTQTSLYKDEIYVPPAPETLAPKFFEDDSALAACYKAYCDCVKREKKGKNKH